MHKNLYAVILSGGIGTRFWPTSRRTQPKQFLKMIGKRSLFQEALVRITPHILPQNIFIVTNRNFKNSLQKQIKGFKIHPAHILLEPQGKNTAPAICWAAWRIRNINPQATLVVLPSDHRIGNHSSFLKSLEKATRAAQEGYLVTLGIVPQRPETGYGYMKIKGRAIPYKTVEVERFVEKPSYPKAKRFVKEKKYLWNSGMFIFRVDVILEEFRKFLPRIYWGLKENNHQHHITKIWPRLSSVSVDYGIFEKSKKLITIPCPTMEWSDVGSWEALVEILKKDKKGNVFKGRVLDIQSRDSFIFAKKRLIAAVGLKDTIVVDSDDALLICQRDLSQKVKDVVTLLKKNNLKNLL